MADAWAYVVGSISRLSTRRCCMPLPTTWWMLCRFELTDDGLRWRFAQVHVPSVTKQANYQLRSRKGGGSAFRDARRAVGSEESRHGMVYIGYTVTRPSPWAGPCTSREAHRYTTYWPPETQDSRPTAGGTRSARETRVGRRWRAIGPVTRSDRFREREDGMTYLTRDPYGKTGDGACARHLHLRYHDWQEEQVPNKVLSRLDQLTLTPCQGNVPEKCRPC